MHRIACSISLAVVAAASAPAQVINAPFNLLYAIRSVGSIPGLNTSYGAIAFHRDDPNKLMCSSWNALGYQNLYTIGVVRNAGGHVTGFTGPLTPIAMAERIDGGMSYHPNGVLFFTRYNNTLGQIRPGSVTADRVDPLVAPTTVGGCAVVPAGMPGAGRLKTLRWPGGGWSDAQLTPDGLGSFNIVGETIMQTLSGGPDGFVYLPTMAPMFTAPSVLVAEYSSGNIAAYQVDSNGDPILATRVDLVIGIPGAFSLCIDPVTYDVLHANWNSSTIDVIEGFGMNCGQCTRYGTGLAGHGGAAPVLTPLSCALNGHGVGVHIGRGRPSAFGVLAIGFTQQSIPLFGGTLLNEASVQLSHTLNAAGAFQLDTTIPTGVTGITLYLQSGYLDPAAPQGISMSNGIAMPIL